METESTGIFFIVASTWMWIVNWIAILFFNYFIFIQELRSAIVWAPLLLSLVSTFAVLAASALLILGWGPTSFLFWLCTIPLAVALQLITTIILTMSNDEDLKANPIQTNQIQTFDESSMIRIIAYASNGYKWCFAIYIIVTFGIFWFKVFRYYRNFKLQQENEIQDEEKS